MTRVVNDGGGEGGDSTTIHKDAVKGFNDVIWERPHDPMALYLPMLRGKLSRGYIYQDPKDPAIKDNPHGRPRGLRFLYNPTDVQVSYSLSTAIFPPGSGGGGGSDVMDLPILGVPGASSVGFDLILDRTYDVWKNRSSRGIMDDVEQFEQMMGYNRHRPFVQPVTMRVVFGNPLLRFYGYIQSFNILYSQWTQFMVPYRGGITGITLQVLADSKKKSVKVHVNQNAATAASGSTTDSTGRDGSS